MTSAAPAHGDEARSGPKPAGVAQPLGLALLLAAATIALYLPVHGHPFLNYDDGLYVTENARVQAPLDWETVRWAFTTFEAGTWHPLTWLSHALDCRLFQLNPAGHHDVNLALAAVNVVLLFGVLLGATGHRARSFMAAALFALHPINVETVAWIAERKNLLSMLFFLLALGAYQWYARQPRTGRYLAVVLLYTLGLLAKPQVVTFPFLLLLWDYWPLRRMFAADAGTATPDTIQPAKLSRLILEKLPLFALSAASAWLTMTAQRAGGDKVWYPLYLRLENAAVSYAQYLRNAVWPTRLAVFYPHPGNSLPAWEAAAALVLLAGITAAVLARRRQRYLVTGWLWFLGAMTPMIGLEGVGYQGMQGMADRYAYLPFIGLFILFCWMAPEWARQRRLSPAWLACGSAAVLSILALLSHAQIGYWSDSATLWSRTLQVTQRNWLAENNLGQVFMSQGRTEEGVAHFLRAAEIYPADPVSNMNLGVYEQQRGNPREAIERFKAALRYSRDARMRTAALHDLSRAYGDLGDAERAEECSAAAEFRGSGVSSCR